MSDSKNNEKIIDYIIDATNVCNWHMANKSIRTSDKNEYNANVSLDTLLKLLNVLLDHQKSFQCIFDANTAYNLPQEERDIYNQLLADYKDYFYQVTGGIKADSFVLSIASNYDSRVISNDNFSDYQGMYPWVKRETRPQRLFKGGIPIIAGIKNLVVPELGVNAALGESTPTLFLELRTKLGFGEGRQEGVVKSFDFKKGNGYITTSGGDEIYFNRSQLNVQEGDKIDFVIKVNNDKKTYAGDIVFIQKEEKEGDKQVKLWEGDKMSDGTIEWFNDTKGFGVINETGSSNKETIFFFRNGYLEDGLPGQGQKVVFEKKVNKKGPHAINIRLGVPENFILAKDIAGAGGKDFEQMKKENVTLNKKLDMLMPLLKSSSQFAFLGTVKKYENGKGIIVLDGGKLELDFNKSNLSGNIEKDMKPNQRVEFKTIVGKKSVKANGIRLSNAPVRTSPPKAAKSGSSSKDPAPSNNRNQNQNNKKSNPRDNKNKQPKQNSQTQNRGTDSNKGGPSKSSEQQNKNSRNRNGKNEKGKQGGKQENRRVEGDKQNTQKGGKQKQEPAKGRGNVNKRETPKKDTSKKQQPQNASSAKSKSKGAKESNGEQKDKLTRPMRPEEQRSFNPQKLVYWGRDKKDQDYLVVIRLNEKERKIDRWLIKETLLAKDQLQRLLNNRIKLTDKDLPANLKPKNLNFSNRNLTPTGFNTNQDVFISQSWLNWHKQLERKENFEAMKEDIIKLHNNVKSNTYFDGSLENEIIKLRDRVLTMENEESTSPQQSKKLNDALGKCYDLLKKKKKKKTIKE